MVTSPQELKMSKIWVFSLITLSSSTPTSNSLDFIMRTTQAFTSITTIVHLYRVLVLSQLDYASPVWSPSYQKYINAIESVQRRFTRFISRKFNLSYCDYQSCCRWLNLLSLCRRKVLHDQILLYKLVHKRALTDPHIVSFCFRADSCTRNQDRFIERTWRLRSTYSAPLPRMVRHHIRFFFGMNIDASLHAFHGDFDGILRQLTIEPD